MVYLAHLVKSKFNYCTLPPSLTLLLKSGSHSFTLVMLRLIGPSVSVPCWPLVALDVLGWLIVSVRLSPPYQSKQASSADRTVLDSSPKREIHIFGISNKVTYEVHLILLIDISDLQHRIFNTKVCIFL